MFKKKKNKALNLTPLIDVMTTLIIFILIQSSDSVVTVEDNVRLSTNEYGDTIKKNENIIVGLKELKIGTDFKINLKNGSFKDSLSHKKEERLIEPLYDQISEMKKVSEESDEKSLNINISFDKRIPSDSVKKVIYTATMAGADNIFYVGEEKQ